MSQTPHVPQSLTVPVGPGAQPPFAVAPTEGRSTRLWWGLGAGAVALVLCVGGGVAALVGISITFTQAIREQGRAVVGDYLDALHEQKYADAYTLLCDRLQKKDTEAEFAAKAAQDPRPESYTLGDLDLQTLEVPADIKYSDGSTDTVRYTLSQDQQTGQLEVCGELP
jgi:hypothetical protein